MKFPKIWAVLSLFALSSLALAQSASNDVEQIIKDRENEITAALTAGDIAEQKAILDSVDANSRKAFTVAH
jgi:hypothetical protein